MTNRTRGRLWELSWQDFRDRSVVSLLASNLIIIALALYERWDLYVLMWLYWTQSIIIGVFWFLRILTHSSLYGRNLLNRDGSAESLHVLARVGAGVFFLFHYGFFHFVYAEFLLSKGFFRGQGQAWPAGPVFISACIFVANQAVSFITGLRQVEQRPAMLTKVMSFPYVRIIPMHFTIIIGGMLHQQRISGAWVLLLFLVLKTAADLNGQAKLKKGFGERELTEAIYRPRPRVRETAGGKELVLSDGRVVGMSECPELVSKIEEVLKLPVDVQDELCRKILAKEKPAPQPVKVSCRCDGTGLIEGEEAVRYAEHHLRFIWNAEDGSMLFVCPRTGKRWIKSGDTLKAKES
ncbi:MAG TPA: DUF6498-containing protein [Sedimentisphaerales bacterium]|nr:DUF6498-containing protein [Sedimentisphaerales bacterium]